MPDTTLTPLQVNILRYVAGWRDWPTDNKRNWPNRTIDSMTRHGLLDSNRRMTAAGRRALGRALEAGL